MIIDFLCATMNEVGLRLLDKEKDIELLFNIYAGTREEIVSYPGWDQKQKEEFINSQFWMQHHAYMSNYSNPEYGVIQYLDKDIGRLYLDIRDDDLRIIDIAILPDSRGFGVGETLISALAAWAAGKGKSISIHVEKQNRAINLYKRLGFVFVEELSAHYLMKKPL